MSPENPGDTAAFDMAALTHALAQAIRTVPGVVELQPTLTGRALHLGRQLLGQQLPARGQGVDVHQDGSGATVTVDVTVSTFRPAVTTAEHIQRLVSTVLADHALPCASVTISILDLRET